MTGAVRLAGDNPATGNTMEAWACGACGRLWADPSTAGQCCACATCGAAVKELRYPGAECHDCMRASWAARDAAHDAKLLAQDPVEDDGEMVYMGDRYFSSLEAAAEHAWDEFEGEDHEFDPATIVVHPCTKRQAPVPDIESYVAESWHELYEDGWEDGFTPATQKLMAELTAALKAEAPTVYDQISEKRVAMPDPRTPAQMTAGTTESDAT